MKIKVYDNFLDDFDFYKKQALSSTFNPVESQGVVYQGVSTDFANRHIMNAISTCMQFKVQSKLNFLRTYQDRPEYKSKGWIHADGSFSEYIAILFIQSSEYWQDDGVCFWKNKTLGCSSLEDPSDSAVKITNDQTLDPEKWKLVKRIEFKPNRIVIAPANMFHSKSTYRNAGKTIETARLVHVLFFDKA